MKYMNTMLILMFALLVGAVNSAFGNQLRFMNETGKWLVLNLQIEGDGLPGYYAIVGPTQQQIFDWGRKDKCVQSIRWAWYNPEARCEDGTRNCLGGLEFVSGGREEYEKFKAGKPLNSSASEKIDSHKLDRVDYQMKAANVIDDRDQSRIDEATKVKVARGSETLNCIDQRYEIMEDGGEPVFYLKY